jgi:ER lumen protein retaining receptor
MIIGGALNLFRLAADLAHLGSFMLLFHKINKARSVEGISLRSQQLYFLVFCSRYLDIFELFSGHHRWSVLIIYNTLMKIFFIASTATIVYYFTRTPWKATYNDKEDTMRHWIFLVLPCFLLALVFKESWTIIDVLYAFSILLEAVAILPQLVMLQRHKNVENLTANYVFLLGVYRGLYLVNWIYRYFVEQHMTAHIVWISGVIQTAIYADFFYYYYLAYKRGAQLVLPQ